MTNLVPRSLVLRFFLAPDDLDCIGEFLHEPAQIRLGEGVQLFNPHHGHFTDVLHITLFSQIVINLTGTEHDTLDFI